MVDAGGGGGGNTSSGAGAGGALLLEAKRVVVEGILAANGGGGGAAQGGSGGQDGRPDAVAAAGEIATLEGQGSAGNAPNGADGKFMTQNQALGGGGGAGRIRINTADGTAQLTRHALAVARDWLRQRRDALSRSSTNHVARSLEPESLSLTPKDLILTPA